MVNKAENYVLVFGGGKSQLPVVQSFAEKGYKTAVVDKNPTAPAMLEAPVPLIASTHDADAVLLSLKDKNLIGQICSISCPTTGWPYVAAARCASSLSLPFPSEGSMLVVLDKYRIWETLLDLKIADRECVAVTPGKLPPRLPDLPLVVKPRMAGGASKGVRVCQSLMELEEAVEYAASFSLDGMAIVENYCAGEEFKLAGLIQNGKVVFMLAARRSFGPGILGQPIGLTVGPDNLAEDCIVANHLVARVEELYSFHGLDNIPFNIDVIITERGPEIIDLDLVLGSFEKLVPAATGIDCTGMYADLCLGKQIYFKQKAWKGAAVTYLWCEGDDIDCSKVLDACCEASENNSFIADPWAIRNVRVQGPMRFGSIISEGDTAINAASRGVAWLERISSSLEHVAPPIKVVIPAASV